MDARQLAYFEAVYEAGNLSHAAAHCNVAASAISHHVSRLEKELGTPLFERKARGMEPTAAGARLHEHARGILRAIEAARDDLRSSATRLVGDIAVGMPFSVIRVIGTDLMERVLAEHPEVRLLLAEALSGLTYASLIAGETELALSYNPPPDTVTRREALLQEELYCVGRPEIVGDADRPIVLNDIGALPLALLRSGTLSRALADRTGALARLEKHATLQLASIAGTLGALEAGLACSLVPKVLVQDQIERGLLVARPILDPTPTRTLYLLSREADRPTRLREAMAALIRDLARSAVAEGRWIAARLPDPA